jgi:threonine/homoserine/homoserine lactone efflux protein
VLTQTPGWFLNFLQIAGGLFILYIARSVLAVLTQTVVTSNLAPSATRRNFFQAALMNVLSPGPYIFWSMIAGPIFLTGWRQSPDLALIFVLGFYSALIGGNMTFVVLFATASRLGPQVSRILRIVSVAALVVFGLYQIWAGVAGLV